MKACLSGVTGGHVLVQSSVLACLIEYHISCSALLNFLFALKLVKEMHYHCWLPCPEFSRFAATAGFLLCMLCGYLGTAKYVLLGSGFYVLKGLIELKKHDLFACMLIKKQCYLSTMMPANEMNSHFSMVRVIVGDTDAIPGVSDVVAYNFWAMKEPEYVMKMMAPDDNFTANHTSRRTIHCWIENGVKNIKESIYKLPFDWHIQYFYALDDHNNLCIHCPAMKTFGLPNVGNVESFWSSWP